LTPKEHLPDLIGPSIFDTPQFAAIGRPTEYDAARQTRLAGEQQIAAIRLVLAQLTIGLSVTSVDDYRAMLERVEFYFRDFFNSVPELGATAFHGLAAYYVKQRDFAGAISWAEKSAGFVAPEQGSALGTLVRDMIKAGARQESSELVRRVATKLPPDAWLAVLTLPKVQAKIKKSNGNPEQLAAQLGITDARADAILKL
jgi:hypothetical protein